MAATDRSFPLTRSFAILRSLPFELDDSKVNPAARYVCRDSNCRCKVRFAKDQAASSPLPSLSLARSLSCLLRGAPSKASSEGQKGIRRSLYEGVRRAFSFLRAMYNAPQ